MGGSGATGEVKCRTDFGSKINLQKDGQYVVDLKRPVGRLDNYHRCTTAEGGFRCCKYYPWWVDDSSFCTNRHGDVFIKLETPQKIVFKPEQVELRLGIFEDRTISVQENSVLDKAVVAARTIEHTGQRAEHLYKIAVAKGGDVKLFDEAIAAAEQHERRYEKDKLLRDIAIAMAEVRLFDNAIQTIGKMDGDSSYGRNGALRGVSVAMAEARQYDKAIETAEKISWEGTKAMALSDIARVKGGDKEIFARAVKEAEKIERSYPSDTTRAYVFYEIAMAKGGDAELFNMVLAETEKTDKLDKLKFLLWVADAKGKDAQLLNKAVSVAGRFEEPERVHYMLAYLMIEAKMFDEALKMTKNTNDMRYKATVLSKVAKAKGGDAKLFDDAVQAAMKIDELQWRADTLSEIATTKRDRKILEMALTEAGKIQDQEERDLTLQGTVLFSDLMTNEWLLKEAPKVAEAITSTKEKALVLLRIAGQKKDKGMFSKAMKVAEGIKDADDQTFIYNEAARSMAMCKFFDMALNAVGKAKGSHPYSDAYRPVAVGLANAREFDRALAVAEMIDPTSIWKADALRLIFWAMRKQEEITCERQNH